MGLEPHSDSNPAHLEWERDFTAAERDITGARFGDRTLVKVAAKGISAVELISRLCSITEPSIDEILQRCHLPRNDQRRLELDQGLLSAAKNLSTIMADYPNGVASFSAALDSDTTLVLNAETDHSPAFASILMGSNIYRVTESGSKLEPIHQTRDPHKVLTTIKFGDDTNQIYLKAMPALSRLETLQGVTGAELRAAVPELAAVFKKHYAGFINGLREIVGNDEVLPREAKTDLKSDYSDQTVQVRLYADQNLELDRFVIVA